MDSGWLSRNDDGYGSRSQSMSSIATSEGDVSTISDRSGIGNLLDDGGVVTDTSNPSRTVSTNAGDSADIDIETETFTDTDTETGTDTDTDTDTDPDTDSKRSASLTPRNLAASAASCIPENASVNGDFKLHLPHFTELDAVSDGSGYSQSFISATSEISDVSDVYHSEGSDQSYFFNAKENLPGDASDVSYEDANESEANSFSASNSESGRSEISASGTLTSGGGDSGSASVTASINRSLNQSLDLSTIENLEFDSQETGNNNNKKNDRNKIDFLKDPVKTMTYGRRIALHLSRRYAWYNPQLRLYSQVNPNEIDDDENIDIEGANGKTKGKPSIEAGWAYFEHITLPRHRYVTKKKKRKFVDGDVKADVNDDGDGGARQELEPEASGSFDSLSRGFRQSLSKILKGDHSCDVAVPGENDYETTLYSPITTPLSQLGDFGLGMGLYFATLRYCGLLLVIAGLMNIPNFIYFSSDAYSEGQENVRLTLQGSAVCTVQEWVPCPGCEDHQFSEGRFLKGCYLDDNNNNCTLPFALKNKCDGATIAAGMVNFATTALVMVGMILMRIYLSRQEVAFDEDEQTAQDYSIVVRNPPHDAVEPEDWINFFQSNFHGVHINCCTVGIDNDTLICALVKRRELIGAINDSLPDEEEISNQDDLKKVAEQIESERNCIKKIGSWIFGGIPEKYKKLVVLNEKILELSKETFRASSVFITFESEAAQRLVLERMNVSHWDAHNQNVHAIGDRNLLFGGNHVCLVEEPAEPSTIRWQDLHTTKLEQAVKFVSTGFALGLLLVSYFIVLEARKVDASFSAIIIAISNSIFPTIAKLLSSFEKHANEERRQVWLYFKIAIFRCVNAAILVYITSPFDSRIMNGDESLLSSVYKVFFAEIVTSSGLQILDLGENFKRHILAPRAKTQVQLNLSMRGSETLLAERYTNMTKLVFMALFYCPLYPGVLFLCAVALLVNFYVDKFSLMRTWSRRAGKLGRSLSRVTRNIAFPIILVVMAFIGTKSWANFNYDSLCLQGSNLEAALLGTYNLPIGSGTNSVYLDSSTPHYSYCESNRAWMSDEQSRLTTIYDIYFFTIAGLIGLLMLVTIIWFFIRQFFIARYEPVGKAMEIPFSSIDSAAFYIPQIDSDHFSYPFIACSIDKLRDSDLLERWNDPNRDVGEFDLTRDLQALCHDNGNEVDLSRALFSRVVHCPADEDKIDSKNSIQESRE